MPSEHLKMAKSLLAAEEVAGPYRPKGAMERATIHAVLALLDHISLASDLESVIRKQQQYIEQLETQLEGARRALRARDEAIAQTLTTP